MNPRLARLVGVGLIGLGSACGTKPEVKSPAGALVKAEPVQDPPKAPAVVAVPHVMPMPGQLKALPRAGLLEAPAAPNAAAVIQEANERAAQKPDESGYFNAVMSYNFTAGALYQVYAAPLRLTDIILEPGEKVLGKPAAGDTIRWVLGMGRSSENGVEQQHIYLKPTRADLQTNLAVNTDRRTYLLELHSYKEAYMAAVQWRYPQEEIEHFEAAAAEQEARDKTTPATHVNLESLHFNYAIKVERGTPRWTPVQVFDDGRKTFIRFPPSMRVGEAPVLFVVAQKDTQLVNYRVKGEWYIVDRLFDLAELRVGQQDQDIVRIVRSH